ncbi:MAG: PSD1 and planctomycete cytochrome C domain-containing protein [Verrucomicrobiales bacterium]|nr:PSD1 and planctomycete cytochrome C domain-containing protein [Verrucomicrobiales bacterium]
MKSKLVSLSILGIFLTGFSNDDPASEDFFENRIRPVLVKHCYDCHSVESGKSKGGLRLDTRESTRSGGDTGAAVIPKNAEESLLLTAILHSDPDLEMPPKEPKLPENVIRDFEAWIEAGAFDPREAMASGAETDAAALQARLEFWSYQKPQKTEPPKTDSDWPVSTIDRFILARLAENDLTPSEDADERTFVRRLYFDLVGLPPTPEQVAGFSYANLEETVDQLLDSEGFGVRWGRHWLDVVRYAESNGREANIVYPHAWRYRDYVIDSINADVPYDQFLTEQIAGDLLPYDDEAQRARLLIATGFLAIGPKGLANQDKPQFAADLVDEQLDATSRAFLATSIACARCHDHKADPIAMTDYYALIGIFRSTKTYYGTWVDSENNNGGELIKLPDLPGQMKPGQSLSKERITKMKAQLAELNAQERKNKEMSASMMGGKKMKREDFNTALREALRIYWTRGGLRGKLAAVDDNGEPLPLCMGVQEAPKMKDSPLYYRGDLKNPGKEVARGVPALFGMVASPPSDQNQSGRLDFAHWVTDPENPLTARVMANRVWGHLFGEGLVRTMDNFGHTGEPPSHPELLDYLAINFRDNGWSLKSLVKEMVLSRAYRQSSTYRKKSFFKDPDNRLLWRANKRRLDAEVIRDSILSVSGRLDLSPRPASLAAEVTNHSVAILGFDKSIPTDLDGSNHRSIFLPVFRENLPDVLHLFDFAEPSLVVGDRDETNVPLQALYLMNSEFIAQQSAAFAERLMREENTREDRIRRAFQLCFNRPPDPEESKMISAYFADSTEVDEVTMATRFCQALLSSAEFRIAD